VVAALIAINLLSLVRARRLSDLHPAELFLQLSIDLGAWSVFLYFTGGATNPLISLLLPLVAIGAATLSAPYAWAVAAEAVTAYSILWDFNEQLDIYDSGLAVHWHLAGMWLTFALSAGVIVWYVVRMTAAIRSRDHALAEAREARLRNERIVALGNLAAGAELGTPWAPWPSSPANWPATLPWMTTCAPTPSCCEQVGHCKAILGNLTLRAGSLRAEGGEVLPADIWLRGIIDRWRSLRPHVPLTTRIDCGDPPPRWWPTPRLSRPSTTSSTTPPTPAPTASNAKPGSTRRRSWCACSTAAPACRRLRPEADLRQDGNGDGLGIGLLLAFGAVERCGGRIVCLVPAAAPSPPSPFPSALRP
jgi:two-component system sensor histidine kinase RegB